MFHVALFETPVTAVPAVILVLGLMVLEYLLGRLTRRAAPTHDLRETAASFAVGFGRTAFKAFDVAVVAVPLVVLYDHRLLTFDPWSPLAVAGAFLGTEFAYYWYHRTAHRVRWLWATHVVHHTPTRLNFTSALRLGWTGTLSGNFLFFLPLAALGFHPLAITLTMGLNLWYQFFIHTECAPRLGPLEWVLNTPAHHRVHHASDAAYLDKNFGGMLIVFDRLFGTFAEAPREAQLRYGVAGGAQTFNPLRLVFGEWLAMARDARTARGPLALFLVLFGPPGEGPPRREGAAPPSALEETAS